MEAFEQVVKVYLEHQKYIVTHGVKFPVSRQTRKKTTEIQKHGYEVDLVAARYDSLVLASVKSFFGSAGVGRQGFRGLADEARRTHYPRYTMFNDEVVREGILTGASERYGYPKDRITMALFVGKFRIAVERAVRRHLNSMIVGGGRVKVVGLLELIETLQTVADEKTYINDAVVMTLKVLRAAKLLRRVAPDADAIAASSSMGELEEHQDAE